MKSEVTVLIPFYNPVKKYLYEALDSVFEQSYKNWKMILIDDGSTENDLTGLENCLKDDRVKLIRNAGNLGQSKSLNAGLQMVDTPFVIQLDSDDLFYPDTLKVLVKEARKQPEKVGLICGNTLIFFEDKKGNIKRTKIRKGRSFTDKYDFLLVNKSLMPRFYRTSALKKMNGWPTDDPYEGRYREDMLIMYRLIEYYHFHWIDRNLYKHRRHRTNQTREIDIYAEITKWSIRHTLKRWGNQYQPVFTTNRSGWVIISRLKARK